MPQCNEKWPSQNNIKHNMIFKSGILEITYLNVALLDKCISQHTKQPVFDLGRIL